MKILCTLLIALATVLPVCAQVASTECLAQLKAVYTQIDHEQLLASDQYTRIRYHHRYVMKTDPDGKKVEGDEWRLYKRGFMHHDAPQFTEVTDAQEAFNHRKFQYVIYRTKSTLEKAALVPGADAGIFDHTTVRECHYVPAPGHDSISYKRAYMTVDKGAPYPVKDLTFVWNPLDSTLISLEVNFSEKSMTKWAKYEFQAIEPGFQPAFPVSDAQSVFMDAPGELKPEHGDVKLMDYR